MKKQKLFIIFASIFTFLTVILGSAYILSSSVIELEDETKFIGNINDNSGSFSEILPVITLIVAFIGMLFFGVSFIFNDRSRKDLSIKTITIQVAISLILFSSIILVAITPSKHDTLSELYTTTPFFLILGIYFLSAFALIVGFIVYLVTSRKEAHTQEESYE